MIRSIKFDPAFDNGEGNKNGVVIRFVLIGDLGCIHFILFTNWNATQYFTPKPIEVGYFSLFSPMFDGQPKDNVCLYLNGAKCYYDGNEQEADEAFDLLKTRGDAAVWELLQIKYKNAFGDLR